MGNIVLDWSDPQLLLQSLFLNLHFFIYSTDFVKASAGGLMSPFDPLGLDTGYWVQGDGVQVSADFWSDGFYLVGLLAGRSDASVLQQSEQRQQREDFHGASTDD